MRKYSYIPAVLFLILVVLFNTVTVRGGTPPVLLSTTPSYSNYWLKNNQVLGFDLACQDEGKLSYSWSVDGVQKSSDRLFNLDGSDYDLGNHEVKGVCDDGAGGVAEKTFNLEIIDESDFTLAVLPDTQVYTQMDVSTPELGHDLFQRQTNWIRELSENLGIKFVMHEGDIVNYASPDDYFAAEWDIASTSMGVLDGVVPYGLSVGNHDYDNKLQNNRDTTFFNQYFGVARLRQSFPENFGGSFNGADATHFNFDHQGLKFSVIFLPFCPTDEALNWADQTISSIGDRRVILVTHAYLKWSGQRINDTTVIDGFGGSCSTYHHPAATDGNTGEEIWQEVLKKYPNVFLTLNGHHHSTFAGSEAAHVVDSGTKGNKVHQIFANYQNRSLFPNGGEAFLRIMRFSPKENKVYVKTYSPWLDEFMTDWDGDPSYEGRNNFEFDYLMNAPKISNINAIPTVNGARVVWSTDFESTSRVKYGRTGKLGYEVKGDVLDTDRTMFLERLSPSTRYYYVVESCDPVGNCATSGPFSFITSASTDSGGVNLPEVRVPIPDAR